MNKMNVRHCSHPGCDKAAVATMSFVYSKLTVLVTTLFIEREPNTFDLCVDHANKVKVPLNWTITKTVEEFVDSYLDDDLVLLAEAVADNNGIIEGSLNKNKRRGHLVLLPSIN